MPARRGVSRCRHSHKRSAGRTPAVAAPRLSRRYELREGALNENLAPAATEGRSGEPARRGDRELWRGRRKRRKKRRAGKAFVPSPSLLDLGPRPRNVDLLHVGNPRRRRREEAAKQVPGELGCPCLVRIVGRGTGSPDADDAVIRLHGREVLRFTSMHPHDIAGKGSQLMRPELSPIRDHAGMM